jgi:hypothetical protein
MCTFLDGRATNPTYVKGMFAAYFPELVEHLDTWDTLIQERTAAYDRLQNRVEREVANRLGNAPWRSDSIRYAFNAHVGRCELSINSPFPEPDLVFTKLPESFGHRGWLMGSDVFAIFDTGASDEEDLRRESEFRDFFLMIRDSEEFGQLRQIWQKVHLGRGPLLAELEAVEHPEHIWGRCEACRRSS